MEYIFVMKFLSWVFAIMMFMGFSFIMSCEKDLMNEDSKMPDLIRQNESHIIEEYNNRNFSGRVAYVLFFGARMLSIMFWGWWKNDKD